MRTTIPDPGHSRAPDLDRVRGAAVRQAAASPEYEAPVDRLASWLARLDDKE
jgi:hypothetical protein